MTLLIPRTRRLPGFAFETRTPAVGELPRLDVAVFAGFAASGPVHVPVPVEDAEAFAAVFGADAPLAWDPGEGRPLRAQLGPAVRMFFANGGRRCWVVRLATDPETASFPVPGVARLDADGEIRALALRARSPGSWADGVRLAAGIRAQRVGSARWSASREALDVTVASTRAIRPGDMLRVRWRSVGVELHGAVGVVEPLEEGRRPRVMVHLGAAAWLREPRFAGSAAGSLLIGEDEVDAWVETAADGSTMLELDLAPENAPREGMVLTGRFDGAPLVLTVRETSATRAGSPVGTATRVAGDVFWHVPPSVAPSESGVVEVLELDLRSRDGDGVERRVHELGLAPGHPRHLMELPADAALYAPDTRIDTAAWREAIVPRFPGAGDDPPALCLPLGVAATAAVWLPATGGEGAALVRDGLAAFDPRLFGDDDLASSHSTRLIADAEFIRDLARVPRPLRAMHCVLALEEPAIIALPDAAQPGWTRPAAAGATVTLLTSNEAEEWGGFKECGVALAPAPALTGRLSDDGARLRLEWTRAADHDEFTVEEADKGGWANARVVATVAGASASLPLPPAGEWHYRVRGEGPVRSEWSVAVQVTLPPAGGWQARGPSGYEDTTLLAAHRMLLRLCGPRRDMLAVLSLPQHFTDEDAIRHVRRLRDRAGPLLPVAPDAAADVPPLATGETDTMGFGALYHGWLHVREPSGEIQALAPDGAACGLIARRSTERGPWVAPANEALRGVVALHETRPAARAEELQAWGVNRVRRTARGFTTMSADTLAADEEVRPINVRMLLILLRRLALRLGSRWVFEPGDDSFRRLVERGFEEALADLFRRGAFAGRTAETAYRVVTDETLNTRASIDAGRFIVELRVAPSRPMEFLTIRLVQTGHRLSVAEV
jgi:hypothetical protein